MSSLYLDYDRTKTAARRLALHGDDFRSPAAKEPGNPSWGDTGLISGFVSTLNDCPVDEVRRLLGERLTWTGDGVDRNATLLGDTEVIDQQTIQRAGDF
ncbi:hypothetical protein [Actinoallomurus acaciae]|uniref:Uncharacterized protein n=1 Tax=Actinoallomurus acaciae TaxID=502577 RepID=A0ABV5YAY4_9ACTN